LRNLALKLSLDVLLRGFIENGARSESTQFGVESYG
jgi:hypothetical protein